MLFSLVIIAILALLALLGWWRAWSLSRRHMAARPSAARQSTNIDDAQKLAGEQISVSIQQATELFQKNLTVQALKINDELESLAGRRLRKQVEDFTAVLDGLTTTASSSVAQLNTLIESRRKALEAGLTTEVLVEKQRAIERFYGRLSDMVASYIIQSLGNDIDLSGQLPFVVKVLDDNKELIKRDLLGDY